MIDSVSLRLHGLEVRLDTRLCSAGFWPGAVGINKDAALKGAATDTGSHLHTVAHVRRLRDTPKHENDPLPYRFAIPPLPSGEGWERNRFPTFSLGERVADDGGRVRVRPVFLNEALNPFEPRLEEAQILWLVDHP